MLCLFHSVQSRFAITLEESLCRYVNCTHAINEYVFSHSVLSDTGWITGQCCVIFILLQLIRIFDPKLSLQNASEDSRIVARTP